MRNLKVNRHQTFYIAFTAALAAFLALSAAATTVSAAAEPPPKDPPPEAERSATGLASLRLVEGTGDVRPDDNDFVSLHYTGWSPAGAQFDTNVGGPPVLLSLENVSPGWHEGLRLMVAGEKRRLWIPGHLAPANPGRGPRGDVIFDVEVVAVYRVPSPPAGIPQPPDDAERTSFGAFTKVVEPGEGIRGDAGTGALVHYTVWTEDGKVLDSTLARQRPTLFLWGKVMPALGDALQRTAAGEKRLIWIPAAVAAGEWPGSPSGALTFEVEVVKIFEEDILAPLPEGAQRVVPEGG